MTISYNLDIATLSHSGFLKILFRWKGSVWKGTFVEFLLWIFMYFLISILYRFFMHREWQSSFEYVAKQLDQKLDYIPIVLLLGFFVTKVFQRWQAIFENIGFIDGAALTTCVYIRGDDNETEAVRRNILRYLCLTQVLVLRDICIPVRKRFPNIESIVSAGYLLPHEQKMLIVQMPHAEHYYLPISWAISLVGQQLDIGHIEEDTYANAILYEIRTFQRRLQTLCNYDWVPMPLAYPQMIFIAIRVFMLVSLVSKQFLNSHDDINGNTIDLAVPFMTMLQVFFYLAWTKVAEQMLNPLGLDDDDFEPNYIIDHNIMMAFKVADTYNKFPEQFPTKIDVHKHWYPKGGNDQTTIPYRGSAIELNKKPIENLKMVVPNYSIQPLNSQNNSRKSYQYMNRNTNCSQQKILYRQISEPAISYTKIHQTNGHNNRYHRERKDSGPTNKISEMYLANPFSLSYDYHPKKSFDSMDETTTPQRLKSNEEVDSEEDSEKMFKNALKK